LDADVAFVCGVGALLGAVSHHVWKSVGIYRVPMWRERASLGMPVVKVFDECDGR